jgi:small subunit ribosomal protein S6
MMPLLSHAAKQAGSSSFEASPIYECTVLLDPGMPSEEAQRTLKSIAQEVEGHGGAVKETDFWGRRGLAYRIGGKTEALFAVLLLEIPPLAVRELSHALDLMKPVLRHLLVKPAPGVPFLRYSERFRQWEEERGQREKREREEREEKLKRQILERAAVQRPPARRPVERKEEKKLEEKEVSLEERLEEIISDENLRL